MNSFFKETFAASTTVEGPFQLTDWVRQIDVPGNWAKSERVILYYQDVEFEVEF